MPLPFVLEAIHIPVVVIIKPAELGSTIVRIIGNTLGAFFKVAEINANIVELVCTRPRCEVCPTGEPPHSLKERHDEVYPGIEEGSEKFSRGQIVGFGQ